MQEKIIYYLKSSENYISGEEISDHLKISRAAIWKHIQELRKGGYDIVAVPHLGYKLISSPDKLLVHEIQHGLSAKILGKKVVYCETVSSTMDAVFEMGLKGEPEGTVVCTENQTKGRGRLGRSWFSPKGKGICMSVLLRPQSSPMDVARLTILTAVAVSEAIKKKTDLAVSIKWPNDLLIRQKKVGGILTELNAEADRVKFVVIGIGLNVNSLKSQLPSGATSLRSETKRPLSRAVLVREILQEMERWYLRIQKEGFAPVAEKWRESSATLHKRIKVVDPGGEVEGEALDIDEDGGLLVRDDSGLVIKKMAGDVVQVR